ncbi:hypothetical protein [Bradyrhizobium sp. WSM1417]|uniref:hypothetical protein n=1 Tax=Bradyrhizobium sp. WSM1417 TaxID=754500 RepID=UPI000484588E|nr:hypothetical protein [Bradyrhizobium sp. WSM1417]
MPRSLALLASAACIALLSTEAFAAKCYVREYAAVGAVTRQGGVALQAAAEPPIVDQAAVDFTSGHAESAAFNSETRYIRVWCDAQASYQTGAAPVATNAMSPLTAAFPEYFGVTPGHKISVVANP